MLMEKAAQTRKQLVDFKTILPFLNSLENKLSSMPKVQYYEGIEGLKKIVDDSCSKDEEVLFISNNNDMHPELREYIEAIYIPKIATHKSKGKMLINDGEKSKKHVEKIRKVKSDQKDEIIFIDPKKYPFKVTTIIHDNKVSFASYDPKDMTGIIIENTLFADHMRTVFNVLMDHFKSQNN
ncbi:MAG: hypothetical protein ACD_51C00332G0003 [uncultured bacterium]|nr:MAG: hypothetical protein ACD_51C00332G0003 [uncultured bacterium]